MPMYPKRVINYSLKRYWLRLEFDSFHFVQTFNLVCWWALGECFHAADSGASRWRGIRRRQQTYHPPRVRKRTSRAYPTPRVNEGLPLLRAFLAIIALCVTGVSSQARSLHIVGAAGYLSEWEFDGEVRERVSGD